jgi:hypothetical protein
VIPGLWGMTGEEFFAALFPYYVAGIIGIPLFYIAYALRQIWRHVRWQTSLLRGDIAPPEQHERPEGTVTDLDRRRRERGLD